jgi:hypothetical protein
MRREGDSGSVTGGILRAVGTGMVIACMALAFKAAFSSAAVAVGDLLGIALTGVAGMACMAGAAAARRECRRLEAAEEETGRPADVVTITGAMPGKEVGESAFTGDREERFVAMLERQSRQGTGRGV